MKKLICALILSFASYGAEINGVLDVAKITTPSAPGTSFSRISVNSTTGVLGCLNDDSTNCFNVNSSAAAAPSLPATTNFYSIGAAASNSRILGIAYAGTSFVTNARMDGTPASPTAVQSGEQIAGYNAFGYDGTSLGGPLGSVRIFANQNFTGSAHGTYIDITTTPNGSTTATQVIQFNADGGITVPSTVTGGDKGAGTINAGGLYINGTAVSTTTGTVTSIATNNGITGGTITSTGTIGLAAISANQVLGALTATNPSGLSVPSCSAAGSALNWTSGTGFGCATGLLSGLTINSTTISGGGTNAVLYGDGTVLQNDTGTTRTGVGQQTHTQTALTNTQSNALILTNTTAATNGATQQFSPVIQFNGNAWKSTATAASQATQFQIGIFNYSASTTVAEEGLYFLPNVNGSTGANYIGFCGSTNSVVPAIAFATTANSSIASGNLCHNGTGSLGFGQPGSQTITFISNGADQGHYDTTGIVMSAAKVVSWSSGASGTSGGDTGLYRMGAGVLGVTKGSSTANGMLEAAGVVSTGTTFTSNAGCSETSLTGGATAGKFTSGTTGTCTTTITMGSSTTAPTGWACTVNDQTTGNLMRTTASTTTTATLSGVTASSDVVTFACVGY